MAQVTGIGGFLFRARDPDALNRWYAEPFGIVMIESRDYADPGWFQDRGETVFSAISTDSAMPGGPEKGWAINLRVDDLALSPGASGACGTRARRAAASRSGRFASPAGP